MGGMQAVVMRAGRVGFRLADRHKRAGTDLQKAPEIFATHNRIERDNVAVTGSVLAVPRGFSFVDHRVRYVVITELALRSVSRGYAFGAGEHSCFQVAADIWGKGTHG